MAFNGSGVFSRIYQWIVDAANGIDIDATRMDTDSNDIAQGLTNCITRDGQSPALANLPMGGFGHTGVADATAVTQYASLGQVQKSSSIYGGVAGGASNAAMTISITPALTAYADGARYHFIATAAAANGGTLAINSLAAIPLVRSDGTTTVGIAANAALEVMYRLSTNKFILLNSQSAAIYPEGIFAAFEFTQSGTTAVLNYKTSNVSSVVRASTGIYTVNFSVNLPSLYYVVCNMQSGSLTTYGAVANIATYGSKLAAAQINIRTFNAASGGLSDIAASSQQAVHVVLMLVPST